MSCCDVRVSSVTCHSGQGACSEIRGGIFRLCGWGLICWLSRNSLAARCQDVPRAASYYFLVTLRYADPRGAFYSDCEFVRQTSEVVPAFSSTEWFNAAVWREIWRRIGDIGVEHNPVQVQWISAHTSAQAFANGRLPGLKRICNAKADSFAKAGADEHSHDANVAMRTRQPYKDVAAHVPLHRYGQRGSVRHWTPRESMARRGSTRPVCGPELLRTRWVSRYVARLVGKRFHCSL